MLRNIYSHREIVSVVLNGEDLTRVGYLLLRATGREGIRETLNSRTLELRETLSAKEQL